MGPRIYGGLDGRNPTISVNGRSYEVTDISMSMGGRKPRPARPLKPETAARIARGLNKIMKEMTPDAH